MARRQALSEDTVYKLLSDPQRLHLLTVLQQQGQLNVETLARQVAARENDTQPEDVREETRRQTTIALVHKHVPLLEDYNVVTYESKTVVPMDVFDELDQYLGDEAGTESVLQKLVPGY